MWPRDQRAALEDMLEHAAKALDAARSRRREEVDTDWLLRLALVKAVEVVGEAAGRVTKENQARFPKIPWREATTTRNRLVHGYDTVDYDMLWDTLLLDFPPLVDALRQALAELDD